MAELGVSFAVMGEVGSGALMLVIVLVIAPGNRIQCVSEGNPGKSLGS